MYFKKPNNIKYTDMCIYCDALIAKKDRTDEELSKAFEYLYHVAFMLAHKNKFFNSAHYYDDFALYFATEMMYRFFYNPKLSQVDEEGNALLCPIKSVLNYMKATIYGRKVNFEQENYCQKIVSIDTSDYALSLRNQLDYINNNENESIQYFKELSKVIKHVVYKNNFYKNDKILMKNIYISCLLTFLNWITFTSKEVEAIKNTYSSTEAKYNFIERLYSYNKKQSPILYHLDSSYSDYVLILSRKCFSKIENDLKEISAYNIPISEAVLSNIVFSEMDGEVEF